MTAPNACYNCGAGYVGDAAFCVQCGAPRHEVFAAQPRPKPRIWLRSGAAIVTLGILGVGAVALFMWLTPPDQPSTTLPQNGTLNGRLRNVGDVHRFDFNTQAGTRTTVEVRSTNGDLQPTVGLIGGDIQPDVTPYNSDTRLTRMTWFNQEATDYHVRIAGANNSKGNYSVTVTTAAPTALTVGQSVPLDFPIGDFAGDFAFDATAGQRATLILDADGAPSGANRDVFVYDSSDNYVAGNNSSDTSPLEVDWSVVTTGHYVVTASVSQDASDEHELLLNLADPTPLAEGGIVDGQLAANAPVADYLLTVTDDGYYQATLDPSDSLYAEMDISDADGNYMTDNSNGSSNTTDWSHLTPGQYHVVVRALDNTDGSFSLSMGRGDAGSLQTGTSTGYVSASTSVSSTVRLDPGQYFDFVMSSSSSSGLDPFISLQDEYGNQLCSNYDYAGGSGAELSSNSCDISSSGLYTLVLTSADSSSGNYSLYVQK